MSERTAAPRGFDAHTAVEDDLIGAVRARIEPGVSGFGGAHGGYVNARRLRSSTESRSSGWTRVRNSS
jgi:hypothetical protein